MFDFLEGDDDLDDGDTFDAELAEATVVYCPYCGESVELLLDASGGETQEYVDGFRRQVPHSSRTGDLALERLDTPATEPEPLQQLRIQGVTSLCL